VGLLELLEFDAAVVQPVEELDRHGHGLFTPQERPVHDGVHAVHPPLVVPAHVALHDVTVMIVGHAGQGLGGPLLITCCQLVAARECAVFDEQAADVIAGPGGRQLVQRLIGDGRATASSDRNVATCG
jgi:hypothetical protein